ncbi:MAG: hypothetical protein NZM12_06805, partial [Steroidobacteraceae bacterium]|nr:hypothetical protein [Steroidobacteraceae bacterium]
SSDAVPAIEVWLRAALNLPHHKMASGSTSSSADRDVMPWFIRAASIVGIVLGAMGAILISMMRGEWSLLRGFLQGLSR